MSRKIVQISSTFDVDASPRPTVTVIALCDDGTVWQQETAYNKPWERLPAIPQDGPADDPREHRIVRHPARYLERKYVENLVRLEDGWWRYLSTDVDAEGQFDNLHRARATGAP